MLVLEELTLKQTAAEKEKKFQLLDLYS